MIALRKEVEKLKALAAGRSRKATATLAALRADPAAALTLTGFDFEEHQAALLRSVCPRELFLSCRQFGKSTSAGLLAVVTALVIGRSLVLLLSPTLRQSGELFGKATAAFEALGRPVPETRRTATTLELLNGSRIVALPGSAENVRGFSKPRLVVVDEAAFARDELFAAVAPMLARSNGRLVLLSSAYGQRGEFYKYWTAGDEWRRTKVVATQCPAISAEFLAAELRTLGPRWFAQEYECVFSSVIDAVFDPAIIEAALESGIRPLFLGERDAVLEPGVAPLNLGLAL